MTKEDLSKQEDPLQKLYTNGNKVNRKLLTELLIDYIGIDKDSLEPVFKPAYQDLKERQKILPYLLYRKSLALLNHIQEKEVGCTSKQIAKATGINYNSVRGYLSQLNPLIQKDKSKGGYYIPAHNLPAIKEQLKISSK